MSENRYDKLDQLGTQNPLPNSPQEAVIEHVKNPCSEPYMIRLVTPEFTSICPVTGQPDFAHIVLDYCPDEWIVESKSYKLFMGSFRNHGDFHEACTTGIGQRIIKEAGIGIRGAAYILMCFINTGPCQKVSGYPIRVCHLIGGGDNFLLKRTILFAKLN